MSGISEGVTHSKFYLRKKKLRGDCTLSIMMTHAEVTGWLIVKILHP